MTTNEIKAKLDALGIAYTSSMNKAALEALLPATDPVAEPAEEPAAEGEEQAPVAETEVNEPAPEAALSDAVTIYDPSNHPHRTYSLADHGEDFRALAEKYVSTRPGWTIH